MKKRPKRAHTRIIATVGPACARVPTLRRMIRAGVSVFRFNFSHGTRADHERMVKRIRQAQDGMRRRVSLLQDLAGHRIRIGQLIGHRPIDLRTGKFLRLCRGPQPGDEQALSLDYHGPFTDIVPDQMIYIDDGRIHLQVTRSRRDNLETQIMQGGVLGERKGVNIPGATLTFPSLSDKDTEDLEFAIDHQVEYVAQSFVRSAADIQAVRERLANRLPGGCVIAKIESREAVQHIATILRAADGIMVARGDLGISVPLHEIPILQKWLIAACNHRRKPVITATQMLEQMMAQRQPTRAEVSDVANAVLDGTDLVMLSGETAIGKYPVEAVEMMHTIIRFTERHARVNRPFRARTT